LAGRFTVYAVPIEVIDSNPVTHINGACKMTTISSNLYAACDCRSDYLAGLVAPGYDDLVEKMLLLGNEVVDKPAAVPDLDDIIKAAAESGAEDVLEQICTAYPEMKQTIAAHKKSALKHARSNTSLKSGNKKTKVDT
jgi:hypothetical protein